MPKRQRGKTKFHLMSRWTKRRHVKDSIRHTEWVNDSSSSDREGDITNIHESTGDEETFPGPSNCKNPKENDIDMSSEISSCPDVPHFFLLSSEESDHPISDSDTEMSRPSFNTDFHHEPDHNEIFITLDEQTPQDDPEQNFLKFLQSWGVNYGIPQNAFDALLLGLREHSCFSNLPRCSRTIMKTPRSLNKIHVAPGEYIHTGIEVQLQKLLTNVSNLESFSKLCLMVNIDGLPPYKSCQGELYPILMSILNIPELKNRVIPVGIYYGLEKPFDVSDFLASFVNEAKFLVENGIKVKNRSLALSISCFCMDAPAKSFVMGINGHGGFYSCTKCNVKGETMENKRVFEDLNCEKRTSIDFLNKTDKQYQTGQTPLTEIPGINFVDTFVLDYMHLVCLGVMRRLLFIWNSGIKSSKKSRLSKGGRDLISNKLLDFKSSVPSEFARKPRDMKLILRWKATELRTFILYLGPVALKGVLDTDKYINFLSLHTAMTILLSPALCSAETFRITARSLLKQFVESVSQLYGRHLITHNFHGLIHLVDDADTFVSYAEDFSLNDISSFPFEEFLQKLKRLLRGRNKPLEQIGRRLAEKYCLDPNVKLIKHSMPYFPQSSSHNNGPLLVFCSNPQYHNVIFSDFTISALSTADRYCGTEKGEIIQVHNIAYCKENKSMVVIGKKFLDMTDFYSISSPDSTPIVSSSELGIYKVKKLSSWYKWPVSRITKKFMCLPCKAYFVVFPLLHLVKNKKIDA